LYSFLLFFLHSLPTRRSSDLISITWNIFFIAIMDNFIVHWFSLLLKPKKNNLLLLFIFKLKQPIILLIYKKKNSNIDNNNNNYIDRKSTRLNSSHLGISYAVF